jgi:hypothetical protein
LATYLLDFKTGEVALLPVFKSSWRILETFVVQLRKGSELASFKKLSANSEAFGAKQLRTY